MNDRSTPTSSPVKMHNKVKHVLDAYRDGGFTAMHEMDLPFPSLTAVSAITGSAFTSGVLGHWVLTQCAANLLKAYGSPELVAKYHEPLTDGRWTGTMALSETQAGSSLIDVSTKATPTDTPGTYKIKGNKMWTSGADHDIYDNIIHMLLAKTPDNKISLFLVPKSIVNEDGSLGERNDYTINGLNHKMGCRGLSNCYWSLGDNSDGATGYLIGEEGKGLHAMFLMMNEMRIHVGLSGALCGKRGHLESLQYAMERKQGRNPKTKEKETIVNYPDVKRMILTQKVFSEGALALCLLASSLADSAKTSDDDKHLLDVLIPIVKSWPSEFCLEANKWAIQVLGGYGYTSDFPLAQVYRDNRLNMIHEGTHGIQSLDLLGRKVAGPGFPILIDRMSKSIEKALQSGDDETIALAAPVKSAVERLVDVTKKLGGVSKAGDVQLALANSHDYLNMAGHTVIGWCWLEMAMAAKSSSSPDSAFNQGKIKAAKFFMAHELHKTEHQAWLLNSLDDTVLKVAVE
eukprot:CAMPEP_0118646984 /NCGR_PEP_ID=MMETSP0785-20121206/8362_1 /TAXON_ID=91992 /ORGANISM="Bolidomonas pacifica, Strain CCMP 1866" /LENGTH=515 /DNA_ID=CAMNT_0006539043 /DNA_START=318 /DNA_END=1862 /DNA_ORIENTATION=+